MHRAALNLAPLFTQIDSRREEYLARLIDYVRRPSISAYGEGMHEVEIGRASCRERV